MTGKYADEVLTYARSIVNGERVACTDAINGCKRFLRMVESGEYDIRTNSADFVIGIIEKTYKHRQGQKLDGTPLRGTPLLLEPWEKYCIYAMLIFYKKGTDERIVKEALIFVPRKSGKAVSLETELPTPDGWRKMRDISTGDVVFGQDGKPARVIAESEIFDKPMYAVTFDDGTVVKASDDHIWTVQTKDSRRAFNRPYVHAGYIKQQYHNNGGWYDTTTAEMAKDFRHIRKDCKGVEYRYRVPMCEPVEYPERDLPIDPYTLGVWLGDGTASNTDITCGDADRDEMIRLLEAHGNKCVWHDSTSVHAGRIMLNSVGRSRPNPMRDALRDLGIFGDKRIPDVYMIASVNQRIELLRGLMDTDGYCGARGECEIAQKKRDLIVQIKELVSSLGLRSGKIKEKHIQCNGKECIAYSMHFFTDKSFPCFGLARKNARLKDHLAPRMRAKSITNIERILNEPSKCIAIDNASHLYLVGRGYVATHNTIFVSALTYALGLLERKSGSKIYVAAAALKQAMETFDNWEYNIEQVLYANRKAAQADGWRVLDNNMEHSIANENIGGGSLKMVALANNPDKQDSFNSNIVVLDEIHAYKSPAQYNRMKEATKAYTNKLCIAITTAGDDPQSFCAKRIEYCQSVLRGDVKDDAYFMFLCHAEQDENGNVDYTNPVEHMKANPNYGVTVRPEDMTNAALQAQNDPQQRKDFLTRSLNVFVSSMRAYFNIDEFKRSNETAGEKLGIDPKWTLDRKLAALVKLPVQWFGGADLSKLHDLTAACLHGCYNGIDIVIPHCWFPIVMAHEKAEQDGIPLFGWQEDGYLDMCNTPTVNHSAVVNWFIRMKKLGFKIKQVGHDRKFCREYFVGMKKAGFNVVDQPQYFFKKSEGFRHIETKAKNGELYYLGAEPYEYCVANVRAIEKTDDMVVFEKIRTERRIDVFDADVFATVRMLEDMTSRKVDAKKWLG
ncbi:MAG: terminase large subunit [Bacteroidales bacterium]|nr:terminase large subunit [Bacteroidales bacterium]